MYVDRRVYDAVEALAGLARLGPDRRWTAEDIEGWLGRPPGAATNLIDRLETAGLIEGGDGAGYRLSTPAAEIRIADILEALAPEESAAHQPVTAMSDDEIATLSGRTLLWKALDACVLLFLQDVSLADTLAEANEPDPAPAGTTTGGRGKPTFTVH